MSVCYFCKNILHLFHLLAFGYYLTAVVLAFLVALITIPCIALYTVHIVQEATGAMLFLGGKSTSSHPVNMPLNKML